jgi:hypothetical protein
MMTLPHYKIEIDRPGGGIATPSVAIIPIFLASSWLTAT